MLTYAIGFVQDVQLTCFAIVLTMMALQNRKSPSLRWLAFGYTSGLVGALIDLGSHRLPAWISLGIVMEAAPVGYACFHFGVVEFTRKAWRTRWISGILLAGSLPFFLVWANLAHLSQSSTLTDFVLAVQTLMTSIVILNADDDETRSPRRTIGAFLAVYSIVEFLRVYIFFATGRMPGEVSPTIENASGIVYVVSCSVLPLAFIWMMNVRLLSHLNRQALIDPLTELLNRRGIANAGGEVLRKYRNSGSDFAVVVVDIDHFKAVNDRFGHASGDQALRGIAAYLKQAMRSGDCIGRLGGEEFVVLLPAVRDAEAYSIAEDLRMGILKHALNVGSDEVFLTASFGIATSAGRREVDWETLVHEADTALYAAKNAGRNATRLYELARA
jgi:diguanylate cyclase (GGDEF)-like protein